VIFKAKGRFVFLSNDNTMRLLIYLCAFYLSIATSYSQVKVTELSHYLFPEFTEGYILMKSGIKNEYLLNYNTLTEEIIFKNRGNTLAIGYTEMLLIDSVVIADRKFFNLNDIFVELIYQLECDLYAENKCKVMYPGKPAAYDGTSQTSASSSFGSLESGNAFYDLKLPDDYEIRPYANYWLRKKGELNKFINLRQLMKLYTGKKRLFKSYVKTNDVKYENQASIIQLIKFMEMQ
jgi:hypothetical protein